MIRLHPCTPLLPGPGILCFEAEDTATGLKVGEYEGSDERGWRCHLKGWRYRDVPRYIPTKPFDTAAECIAALEAHAR